MNTPRIACRLLTCALIVGVAGPAVAGSPLDLAALKALAIERQPAVAAARSSLAAALARKQAVDNLKVPTCLQRDLPTRRQQSALGPAAGEASVRVAELNAIYAVEYTYTTYVYALAQQNVVETTVRNLGQMDDVLTRVAKRLEKDPDFDTELRPADRDRVRGVIELAKARVEEAVTGARRALVALHEAAGVGEDCLIMLPQEGLTEVQVDLDCRLLVELALANRPEVAQTAIAAEVMKLEVAAQACRSRSLSVRTFAASTDIHATPLSAGSTAGDYAPGVVGPEMPVSISGKVCDRVAIASAYHDRSHAVVEKTRGLIRLEVELACLRYDEARRKLPGFVRGAALAAASIRGQLERIDLGRGSLARLETLLGTAALSTQMRASANEARYQMRLALITLERATGGAFRAAGSSK